MLTTAEHRAETHICRLDDSDREQLRNQLIGKWVLVAVFAALRRRGSLGPRSTQDPGAGRGPGDHLESARSSAMAPRTPVPRGE